MVRAYIIWFTTLLVTFFGTFINSSLVIYDFYPDFIGFVIETLFILVLGLAVFYGAYRIFNFLPIKFKLIHVFVMTLLAILSTMMIVKVYLPIATEMYEGVHNCALCP